MKEIAGKIASVFKKDGSVDNLRFTAKELKDLNGKKVLFWWDGNGKNTFLRKACADLSKAGAEVEIIENTIPTEITAEMVSKSIRDSKKNPAMVIVANGRSQNSMIHCNKTLILMLKKRTVSRLT